MPASAPPGIGLLKGLGVTIKFLFQRPTTQMYPYERPELAPRTRGVIALMDENCTVCMLCSRECPDWCIYIESHKETVPPAKEGGRARTRNVLDRFAIDFSLCMYCGICVEVCPFDALWWSPEFEYSEYHMDALLHEQPKLREWADTVPPPPPLEDGAIRPAEVTDAIAKAAKERELEAAKQDEARKAAEAPKEAAAGAKAKAAEPEFEVKAGEIDQEVFDQLIAEGKSERIARSKAKAAYVKKEKARLRAEAESAAAAAPAPKAAEVEVKAGEIDQETFDQLIAEGKPERMARAKAKAAYVKKEKARLRAEAEAGADASPAAATEAGPAADADAAPAAAPKAAEVEVKAGEIDQETFDQLIAEGKPERMARAKAKAAYVKKEKARLRAEAEAGAPAADAAPADADAAPADADAAPADADASPAAAGADSTPAAEADAESASPKPKLADVHVEGAGEIDQEVFDQLIAEGKSERIARSKAKAAWIKKRKQQMLDEESDG